MDITPYYIEKGTGTPLILLHGNGENSEYFDNQIETLSSEYRVIAVDTRGHGKTPRGTAAFTIRQFAKDLLAFLEALKIEKACILGFSDGANIAMCFAAAYPDRVIKLILNGGNLNAKGVKAFVQIPIEIGYRVAGFFSRFSKKAEESRELLGLMVNEPNIPASDLKKITAETLVIAGTRDMIKRKHTEFIASCIKNAQLIFIDGDHFIAKKQPVAFNGAVRKFLNK